MKPGLIIEKVGDTGATTTIVAECAWSYQND
jgi:hypothetical protein